MSEENELFFRFEELFWKVTRSMGQVWTKIFEKHLPGSQSYLIFMLERKGPTRMSELADALHLTAGAVTIASDKLIERGYVERKRDEQDRRVVYLVLTEKGQETMEMLRSEGRQMMKHVFSHLSESELHRMIESFEEANGKITMFQRGEMK